MKNVRAAKSESVRTVGREAVVGVGYRLLEEALRRRESVQHRVVQYLLGHERLRRHAVYVLYFDAEV